jgi:exonuclease SbcC
MKLNKITLENIRSYEKQEINFPDGSVLLSGDIGSGKSTILLAIEFALFGLQRGKSGEGLLRNGKKDGSVKLGFEIDGKNIEIERRLKKSKDSVNQEKCLLKIGVEEKELTANEIKSKILSLLNYPSEFQTKNPVLFRYTVYTPQEEMKTILIEDAELRMNTLRRVFDIDKYKRITENIDKINSKIREEIRGKEGSILDLSSKKSELASKDSEIKTLKGDFAVSKVKHEEILKIVKERRDNLDLYEAKIKELNVLRTEFARKESDIQSKKLSIKRSADEIEILKKQISAMEKELSPIEQKNFSETIIQYERSLKDKETEFLMINRRIAALESEKNRNGKLSEDIIHLQECPTCRQNVSEEHKHAIRKKSEDEIARINFDLGKEIKNKDIFSASISEIKKEISILREKDKEMSLARLKVANLREKQQRERALQDNIKSDENKIKEFEVAIEIFAGRIKELSSAEKNYLLAKNMLTEAIEEERGIAINSAKIEKQIEGINYALSSLNKEIAEKEKIKEKTVYFKKIKDWLSESFIPIVAEIEKNVMTKVHYEFSQLFGKWFSILAEGLSARINEEFTPIIEQNGYEIDYDFLSGGERTAAALAYRLALNHTVNSLRSNIKTRDLLILDEPTDGFSAEQLDKIRDVLDELKTEQLIIVSHEQKIEGFVDKIIRLEKNSGITRVN